MRKARAFFFVCLGIVCLAVAYHFGATAAHSGIEEVTPTETVVVTGTCGNEYEIPLPTYRDGTTALESECQCLAIPQQIPTYSTYLRCYTEGRFVRLECDGPTAPQYRQPVATYVVVAVREATMPTAAQSMSMGQLKAKYATPTARK